MLDVGGLPWTRGGGEARYLPQVGQIQPSLLGSNWVPHSPHTTERGAPRSGGLERGGVSGVGGGGWAINRRARWKIKNRTATVKMKRVMGSFADQLSCSRPCSSAEFMA